MSGTKFDSEKPMMVLIDPYFHEALASVMTMGAAKYDAFNWTQGIKINRLISSLDRHLLEVKKGIDLDSESGISHCAHIAANAMFLFWMIKNRPEMDDRFYKIKREDV